MAPSLIIALNFPAYASANENWEMLFVAGSITAVCDMHSDGYISTELAKKYVFAYFDGYKNIANKRDLIEGFKRKMPDCPVPENQNL